MKKVIRYFGWALLALVVFGVVAAGAAHLLAQRKLNRSIELKVAPVAFVSDDASLARGKYLFQSRGCGECHGDNGAGKLLIDDPGGLRVWTPNITAGPGSAVAKYTESDWVRTIRHGVKPAPKTFPLDSTSRSCRGSPMSTRESARIHTITLMT